MSVKIFISYAREDQDAAKRIYRDLTDKGIDAWLDCEKLRVGQNWKHMRSARP
ncbi:MAG: TIR domain-containing protein [Desulfobacteraceae bacterium]|nr:TIR domain-containing protein [Desulfobacteraceae bacterium]